VGAETSAEVRGSWGANTWNVGVSMTQNGGTWTATVAIPWQTDTQYKFYLSDGTWHQDPNNPTSVSDGFGGFNSVVSAPSCSMGYCPAP
jgi:hypothetical protein